MPSAGFWGRWRFKDWSLRLKMIALLVVASLLPLAIAAVVDIREARQRASQAATNLLSARADELVGRLDTLNQGYARSVGRLAGLPTIVETSAERADHASLIRATFDVWVGSDPAIRSVALLNSMGVVKLATELHLIGRELSGRSYIGEALRGSPVISDVHVAEREAGDVPTVAYVSPVRDSGSVVGFVVLFVRASAVWDVMKASNELAGKGSFAVMFDRDGVRIGHTYNRDIVFHPGGTLEAATVERWVAERRLGDDTRRLLSEPRAFPEQFDRARAEAPDRGVFRGFAPVNSKWNVGVARRLATTTWTVFYMLPEATLEASSASLTRTKGVFAGVIIVLALIVGLLFATVILTPIRALSAATHALARGDRSARVKASGADELGTLAGNFNAMVDEIGGQATALEAARDELEARVIQRTTELAESEQRLSTTLLSIGDAVIATDAEGRVTRMNPVAEQLTGWPLAEANGRLLTDVFSIHNEDTGATVENPAERVLRDGVVVGLANHTALVARDGVTRPIADSGAPIRDASGAIHGVVLVFRDMTADRAAEDERLRAIELGAENRRVQEASRMKSEFLANMSHELRTPLNSIIGFGDLLHDEDVGPLAPDQKEFIGNIVASGRHLLQLINDVLDLSKVEAGKMTFRPEPVVLATVLGEVIAILRTTAAMRGVRLTTAVDPELREIVIDPARLKQIFYNYLSNAIKFTSPNGNVEARIVAVSSDQFQIEVEDTGIGIAPEDIPRLFIEFQQLDAGAAKKHGGTGLGLALTKRLVEAQGGDVGVTSVLGRGSVFRAMLPRRPKAQTRDIPTIIATATVSPLPSDAAVLVVEDNAVDRNAIAESLRAAGYLIDVAETAAVAIAKCKERAYLAITLDLVLPDGSGLDVLRTVRADGPNRDVKIVVVTVVAEPGAVAGFAVDDILGKPLEPDALVAALRRAGVPPISEGEVWVVDDDQGSRKLMTATLEQLGFRVAVYEDGPTALRRLHDCTPLAVVVDLLMPEMDGFELIERLRAVEACRSIPIIVWTVKDLSTDEYERLRQTAQVVLAKGSGAGAGLANVLRGVLPMPEKKSHGA